MANHYVVMLNMGGNPAIYHAKIEGALNLVASDWLRYGNLQYLVVTDLTAEQLYEKIKPQVPPKTNLVVMGVNLMDRFGYASTMAVDWIKKHAP